VSEHGYGPYTRGCRCDVCRAAKAEYMRARRVTGQAKRAAAESDGWGRHFVPDITHGIGGYDNFSCRCSICCSAKRAAGRRQYRRQVAQKGAA
jgi:hypothetical protein